MRHIALANILKECYLEKAYKGIVHARSKHHYVTFITFSQHSHEKKTIVNLAVHLFRLNGFHFMSTSLTPNLNTTSPSLLNPCYLDYHEDRKKLLQEEKQHHKKEVGGMSIVSSYGEHTLLTIAYFLRYKVGHQLIIEVGSRSRPTITITERMFPKNL